MQTSFGLAHGCPRRSEAWRQQQTVRLKRRCESTSCDTRSLDSTPIWLSMCRSTGMILMRPFGLTEKYLAS